MDSNLQTAKKHAIRLPAATLCQFMVDTFVALGVSKDDAQISADVLISSDLRGIDSHGISRLKPIYVDKIIAGVINPKTHFEIVREGPTTAVVDGHNSLGHVIAKRAMGLAIDKAKQYGMGMVAVRNSSHYGIAGYYPMMAADNGMIGITGTNARPSIAPTFGVEPLLGTNPLCFGMPTDEEFPFVLDCATSTSQRGKVEVYARYDQPVPEGWVIDQEGKSLTNAKQILDLLVQGRAAFTPLGGAGEDQAGYKGYGYATVVEILSAALQSGSYLTMLTGMSDGKPAPARLGHFFMAVDITAFTELEQFRKITGDILRRLREAKKAPGAERIYTAGEKEYLSINDRREKGIPITESLQEDMLAIAKQLDLTDKLPF